MPREHESEQSPQGGKPPKYKPKVDPKLPSRNDRKYRPKADQDLKSRRDEGAQQGDRR